MKPKQSSEETRPLSALAKRTARIVQGQLQLELQGALNIVAAEALESMGLAPTDGWVVDFDRGVAVLRNGK